MLTPSRASISARRRGMVQLGRSATGSASRGMATRSATSLFTGAGPGATAAFNASTSPLMKSPRQSRTVSSRTPNASAIRPLVQPASVSSTARARSASPRSREHAKQANSACWFLVADKRDFPAMLSDRKSLQSGNQTTIRWLTRRLLLSDCHSVDAAGVPFCPELDRGAEWTRLAVSVRSRCAGQAAEICGAHFWITPQRLRFAAD